MLKNLSGETSLAQRLRTQSLPQTRSPHRIQVLEEYNYIVCMKAEKERGGTAEGKEVTVCLARMFNVQLMGMDVRGFNDVDKVMSATRT